MDSTKTFKRLNTLVGKREEANTVTIEVEITTEVVKTIEVAEEVTQEMVQTEVMATEGITSIRIHEAEEEAISSSLMRSRITSISRATTLRITIKE